MAKPMLISPISKQGIQLLRVAAYCRVSSSSADQLNSYATQIDYYTKQFTRLEKMISDANSQSSALMGLMGY